MICDAQLNKPEKNYNLTHCLRVLFRESLRNGEMFQQKIVIVIIISHNFNDVNWPQDQKPGRGF